MRFLVFEHKGTYQRIVRDDKKLRLRRLQRRIASWYEVMGNPYGYKWYMITLTYTPDLRRWSKGYYTAWSPRHISQYLAIMRKQLGKALYGYAWIAEVQERGEVHYHIMVLSKKWPRKPDRSGAWPWGISRVEVAKKGPWYLIKYAGKEKQKYFCFMPKGMRVFGISIKELGLRVRYWYKCVWNRFQRMVYDQYNLAAVKWWGKWGKLDSDWRLVYSTDNGRIAELIAGG